ncbi:uncharacterized protein J7T54_000445 [Emericellopsis cladophorae]|uniref:RRM domain-containing protein n=1 Tax=Emericellopsis cladophorae TaxID=2686198 RepID=A0A9Q0BBI5_9HYPO|nr:uncharacterized protein J7T54_000445 [Emericellopsis cladophorae]KAI6779347.1 hypothetical protein J7T54_000445 [Emericellopsis cladophorae]
MHAVTNPNSRPPQPLAPHRPVLPGTAIGGPSGPLFAFSPAYQGQHSHQNASANIPDTLNCAVWVRNLPPDVTYHELLSTVRHIGRVWCSYINEPDYIRHTTAAAKIVFFRPVAAQRYLVHINSMRPAIRGFAVRVAYNRVKIPAQPDHNTNHSRCILVTGTKAFARWANLEAWFQRLFVFQVDEA